MSGGMRLKGVASAYCARCNRRKTTEPFEDLLCDACKKIKSPFDKYEEKK